MGQGGTDILGGRGKGDRERNSEGGRVEREGGRERGGGEREWEGGGVEKEKCSASS